MEHWDHRACEGLASGGALMATLISGVSFVLLFGAIGLGIL